MKQVILSDENCSGQCEAIFHALERDGYVELLSLELRRIEDVGLHEGTDDETVWRLCQEKGYLLVTGNRTTKDGQRSLEMVVRHLVEPTSLPVVTIGKLSRALKDRLYCERCAENLAELIFDLENHLGVTRVYI